MLLSEPMPAVKDNARASAFLACRRLGDQLRCLLESLHVALFSRKGLFLFG